MRPRILWAIAGVSIAAIVALLFLGYAQPSRGTDATIGAPSQTDQDAVERFEEFMQNEEFRQANDATTRLAFELGRKMVNRRPPCVRFSGNLCTVYGLCCVSCNDSRCGTVVD